MSTDYGNFYNFCRDSTLPVCNIFPSSTTYDPPGDGFTGHGGGCVLNGISLSGGRHLRNLGSILLDGAAILITIALLFLTQRKRAAVGRREMQIFLCGFIVMSICEIFTVGGIPLPSDVYIAFTGVHIAAIVATTWVLMLNGAVGYQFIDDGNFLSVFLTFGSAAALFIGTGYIVLDTGYDWTGYFQDDVTSLNNRSYPIYTLYLLAPIVFLFIYFCLETFLVLKVLGERKPMLYLILAVLFFAIGQIFDFLISVHICTGTSGQVDGALFETFFTLLAVIMVWVFWSSITEDDWPTLGQEGSVVDDGPQEHYG